MAPRRVTGGRGDLRDFTVKAGVKSMVKVKVKMKVKVLKKK